MATILVLNGPNLNLLGKREPELYGTATLDDIERMLESDSNATGHTLQFFQTNAEHGLIERIHQAQEQAVDFIIINPGSFTHTSIALRDALLGVKIPFIEVHLSNVFARETYRQHSFLSDIAVGVISGLGAQGYQFALHAAIQRIKEE